MTDNNEIQDFDGDDFAHDKEIQKNRAAAKAYEKMLDDSFSILNEKLLVENASHRNLKSFLMFKNLQAVILRSWKSYQLDLKLHISLAEYPSSFSAGKLRGSGFDSYLFGHLSLNHSYPNTYICKETIREKIMDIFQRLEVDFENSKRFSRKFHVLTKDKFQLTQMLQFKNLDELTPYSDMEVEIHDKACLFRCSRYPISIEETIKFCELTNTLLQILK